MGWSFGLRTLAEYSERFMSFDAQSIHPSLLLGVISRRAVTLVVFPKRSKVKMCA